MLKDPRSSRRLSRPARLRAVEEELRRLAAEYQAWLDALPENMADGWMADWLEETIGTLEDTASEIGGIDPARVAPIPF